MEARRWIECDESAKEMLARILAQRPFLLLPPLHRVPLRVGNIVEIVGPSPSAKSEILLQAAVNCILPKEWNGIYLGGLERLVMYFDLDCRFDVIRLSQALSYRLTEAGFARGGLQDGSQKCNETMVPAAHHDDELFLACMRRFLYNRCYNSYEFLAALKTMHRQIQKQREAQGVGVHFLMIDSISAFYWMDRAFQPLSPVGCNRRYNYNHGGKMGFPEQRRMSIKHARRNLSFQCITESIVLEINRLLQIEPMLVLATKTTILGIERTRNETQRLSSEDSSDLRVSSREKEMHLYREFMPSAWQLFVTHRILLQVSEAKFGDMYDGLFPIYTCRWLLPPLNHVDDFTVRDVGLFFPSCPFQH